MECEVSFSDRAKGDALPQRRRTTRNSDIIEARSSTEIGLSGRLLASKVRADVPSDGGVVYDRRNDPFLELILRLKLYIIEIGSLIGLAVLVYLAVRRELGM
jgi:hypothetical protein